MGIFPVRLKRTFAAGLLGKVFSLLGEKHSLEATFSRAFFLGMLTSLDVFWTYCTGVLSAEDGANSRDGRVESWKEPLSLRA